MKRCLGVLWWWCTMCTLAAQSFNLEGGTLAPYIYTPDASTGLQRIYVANGFDGVRLSFASATRNALRWFSYTQRASELTPLEGEQTGSVTVLTSPLQTNTGYVVQDGDRSYYVWMFDYSRSPSILKSLRFEDDASASCDGLTLAVDRSALPLVYYTITGVRKNLDREYRLNYTTREFNQTTRRFEPKEVEATYKGDFSKISIDPPYCNTDFRLSGDQFALHFALPSEIRSEEYSAVAVVLHTEAFQDDTLTASDRLGGSAPVEIDFEAYANTPLATFYKWDYTDDPTFEKLIATYSDQSIRLNFEQSGTYYVRCTVSNGSNTCKSVSEIYTIPLSDSYLKVPNAFSPQGSPGVNDLFKPRCKSLIQFEAYIFNKWGVELYRWNDPNGGWDGKHNGKYVLPGPYYYVIKATGADGKQYHLKGDINVVGGEEKIIHN